MNIVGKRVAYITLGCKLNFSETSTIKHSLEQEGAVTVGEKDGADIFVINTCSVTDIAEKKGRHDPENHPPKPRSLHCCGWLLCPTQSARNHGH